MAAARSIESLQQANVSHHQDSRSLSTTIEPKHGGFKERFLLKLEEKYKCEYCRHALCNPKQTECGHRFCESCLSEIFRNRNAVCPVDNEPLFEAKVFKDICCKREILSLKIYCRNEKNGCKEQLSLGKLEAHLLECPYQEVRCARRGCTEKVQRKDLADHLNSSCKYREQMCKLCRKEITMAELKKHEETECPSVLVKCPNKCNISVLRSELSSHLLLCPNVVVHCSYSTYGCNFLGTNQELKVHEANSMAQHLNLSMIRNIDNETKVSQLQSELQDKCKIIQSMSVQISNLEKELVKFGQLANKNEGRLGHLQKMMASQTDQLFTINQTSQQTQQKHEEMSRETKVVKESVDGLQTRVRQLEVTSRAGSTAAGQGSQTGLDNQVRRHDSLLSVHDVRLADIDLRFQVLETASYNGRLIWKIREYTRRKQEAVSGKTLSLYSQPFYTGYFGYKMCARVYLNGDGMGKGTHLSLFFVVMRGEYDALLPWPFKQKVTLMLLDQGTGGCHLGDAFKPDPNSSSFKRPQGEMNIASGCPLFVTQTVLESKTYIKDDTIFIKVGVDTSDLPDP